MCRSLQSEPAARPSDKSKAMHRSLPPGGGNVREGVEHHADPKSAERIANAFVEAEQRGIEGGRHERDGVAGGKVQLEQAVSQRHHGCRPTFQQRERADIGIEAPTPLRTLRTQTVQSRFLYVDPIDRVCGSKPGWRFANGSLAIQQQFHIRHSTPHGTQPAYGRMQWHNVHFKAGSGIERSSSEVQKAWSSRAAAINVSSRSTFKFPGAWRPGAARRLRPAPVPRTPRCGAGR